MREEFILAKYDTDPDIASRMGIDQMKLIPNNNNVKLTCDSLVVPFEECKTQVYKIVED